MDTINFLQSGQVALLAHQPQSSVATPAPKAKCSRYNKLITATAAIALIVQLFHQLSYRHAVAKETVRFSGFRQALADKNCTQAMNIVKGMGMGQYQAVAILDEWPLKDNCLSKLQTGELKELAKQFTDEKVKSVVLRRPLLNALNNATHDVHFHLIYDVDFQLTEEARQIPDPFLRDIALDKLASHLGDIALKKRAPSESEEREIQKEAIEAMTLSSMQKLTVKRALNQRSDLDLVSMMSTGEAKFYELVSLAHMQCLGEMFRKPASQMKNIVDDLSNLAFPQSYVLKEQALYAFGKNNEYCASDLTRLIALPEVQEEMNFYIAEHGQDLMLREHAADKLPAWAQPSYYTELAQKHEQEGRPAEAARIRAKI